MALPAATTAFIAHHRKPLKRFRVDVAYSAVHHPVSFDLTDGDDGHGHVVETDAVVIPRLGPDRACLKGETLRFYSGDSAVRGGGAATGPTWAAYYLGTDTPHDNEFGGTEEPGAVVSPHPDGGGNPATMAFTPTQAGHYRIELGLDGMPTGDGITAPYGKMCKYVRVFDTDIDGKQAEWDGLGVATISLNGSLENGGYTGSLSIKRGRGIAAPYPVANQRVILHVKTWYSGGGGDPWAEYTWNPGHGTTDYVWYSPNIFFEGLIRGEGVVENHLTGDVSFSLVGVRAALDQLSFPLVPREISIKGLGAPDVPGTGFQDFAGTSFMDQSSYDLLISKVPAKAQAFFWVHRIPDMKFSDPVIHLLTRHTNFATFFDLNIWQNDTDSLLYADMSETSVMGWIKKLETERFGVVFSDAKGVLAIGPEPDLRGPDYWASIADPDIVVDGTLYRDIHVQRSIEKVSQVVLVSIDQAEILPTAFRSDAGDDLLRLIQRKQHTATWPSNRATGVRFEKFGVPIYGRSELATVARRLHKRLNKEYPAVQMNFQMLTGLDLLQNVGVTFAPRRGMPDGGWTEKLTHVTGIQHQINVSGLQWATSVTVAETVDAAAVQVPDVAPTAAFDAVAAREVMADGTEKRFVLLRSRAIEGDADLASVLWQSDGGGGAKQGVRVVYTYDESVSSVTIQHTVIDTAGLSDTKTRVIDLSALPANAATFAETVWAASAAGAHVTPDGGATWIESAEVGDATAVWASDDSSYGFYGNAAGGVYLTQDLGSSFTTVADGVLPSSPVTALWGDEKYPSAIVGYQNGQLWEVAQRVRKGTLIAAEIAEFRHQMGNTAPVRFVYVTEALLFVGAGDFLYAGTRSDWRKLARFPGTIVRGAARGQPAVDVYAGDGGYTFIISLVFQVGAENFQEQGRVKVGGAAGIEWISEGITPVPAGAGSDTAVGAIDQGGAILSTFGSDDLPYLLPSSVHDTPGPARIASTATPGITSLQAVEYGLDGRDHAFVGHLEGIHKNFDPNAAGTLVTGGGGGESYVPAPSNLWLPFKEIAAQVKDIFVTRPKEGVSLTTYDGMVYLVFAPRVSGAVNDYARMQIVVWSPRSDPPQYVTVDAARAADLGLTDIRASMMHRVGSATTRRAFSGGYNADTVATGLALPPGFTSLTKFGVTNDDIYFESQGNVAALIVFAAETYYDIPAGVAPGQGSPWLLDGGGIVGRVVRGARMTVHANPNVMISKPDGTHYWYAQETVAPGSRGDTANNGQFIASVLRSYAPRAKVRSIAGAGYPDGGYHVFFATLTASGLFEVHDADFHRGAATDVPARLLSHEYHAWDNRLWYWDPESFDRADWQEVLDEGGASFTGMNALGAESFDTHWFVTGAGTSGWKIYRRTSNTVFTRWTPTTALPAGDILAPMTSDNSAASGVFVLAKTGGGFLLLLVRADGTWEDRSGNLWTSYTGAPRVTYTQDWLGDIAPQTLRHVLPSEFEPVQVTIE